MSRMRAEMKERALNTARRIVRLLECDAPGVILANEMSMLNERMSLVDPHYLEAAANIEAERAKCRYGYCAYPHCEQEKVPFEGEHADVLEKYCELHQESMAKDLEEASSLTDEELFS